MACVHPAALQLFQKLVESMLGPGSEGDTVGEEGEDPRDTQIISGGAGEMAEPVTLPGLEGGGPAELC